MKTSWDTIVIGSGIAGLTAASALARCGHRVLMLEQHAVAGGQTQTFQRQRWHFATGVHYIGGVGGQPGAAGQFGRLLGWLSGDQLAFRACGSPYDIVRLPGFEFGIEHPESAYRAALLEQFPHEREAIDNWFDEMAVARRTAMQRQVLRGLPPALAWAWRLWGAKNWRRLSQRTLAQALEPIGDARLRAVLGARWGNYGAVPAQAPLVEHALVTGSFNDGAYYPEGGPARFAEILQPVIEAAGGQVRTGAAVERILMEDGHAQGVIWHEQGGPRQARAQRVIAAMSVSKTIGFLDADVAPNWQAMVRTLKPGLAYVAMYLGFEGDIAAAGATAANLWIYEDGDIDRAWQQPADEDAPGLFVTFPSLKDPHPADPSGVPLHTGEVLALCEVQAFEPWLGAQGTQRPEDYLAFKAWIEARLLAQFRRHFPRLAPMLRYHELATPLTQEHYVRTPAGAMYGLEMSTRRLASPALAVRSPVPGLLIAGQDITGAGVHGACMSGLAAAAAIEPTLVRRLSG